MDNLLEILSTGNPSYFFRGNLEAKYQGRSLPLAGLTLLENNEGKKIISLDFRAKNPIKNKLN